MARPSKESFVQPLRIKAKKFDDALAKIRESLEREPAKLVSTGIYIGTAQGLCVDLSQSLIHYGFIEEEDARMAQIENALNTIETCLKEAEVNIPLIGFNVGVATVSSDILKEDLGLTSVAPKASTAK